MFILVLIFRTEKRKILLISNTEWKDVGKKKLINGQNIFKEISNTRRPGNLTLSQREIATATEIVFNDLCRTQMLMIHSQTS